MGRNGRNNCGNKQLGSIKEKATPAMAMAASYTARNPRKRRRRTCSGNDMPKDMTERANLEMQTTHSLHDEHREAKVDHHK